MLHVKFLSVVVVLSHRFVVLTAAFAIALTGTAKAHYKIVECLPGTWVDVSGTGTALNLSDDGEVNLSTTVGNGMLGAGVIRVGSNGAARWAGTGQGLDYDNAAIPDNIQLWGFFGTACGNCPWDIGPPGPNGNVGPEDLGELLGCWGSVTPGDPCECFDIGPPEPNGNIGPEDLGELLGAWGPCPECLDAGDCQDGDVCTIDSCEFVDGSWVCINAPIVPCCGNGIVEAGEECDPPDGENCDKNCQLIGACPGPGDCCTANGTPGCEDEECCNAVCAGDPFCCDTVWDEFCAEDAHAICGFCVSDCCIPHDTPGCDDFTCEDAVCFIDPFCCSSAWGQTCVNWALLFCPDLCGG